MSLCSSTAVCQHEASEYAVDEHSFAFETNSYVVVSRGEVGVRAFNPVSFRFLPKEL